jgi:hypothetical protein
MQALTVALGLAVPAQAVGPSPLDGATSHDGLQKLRGADRESMRAEVP